MILAASLPARLRQLGRAVVDGVLPPRCLACGATVGEPHSLCAACWSAMTFFAPPWCAVCGHPARLNFGDCFSYALARSRREPLLFKGEDFIHTDVASALP